MDNFQTFLLPSFQVIEELGEGSKRKEDSREGQLIKTASQYGF